MKEFIEVVTTTADIEEAETIAETVLAKRLAACVQISEIKSLYRWQGKIEKDSEFLCTMKSRRDLFQEIEQVIKKMHSYDLPEIITTAITDGSKEYLTWLDQELTNDHAE